MNITSLGFDLRSDTSYQNGLCSLFQVNCLIWSELIHANKIIATFTKQYLMGAKDNGSITFEERTNTIIANLTQRNLEKLRQFVVEMDVPAKIMP